jgi:hypothetical protein
MGSVPSLTTTGDNDPEIVPVRYNRHYLYCDACGSFELDPWITPGDWKGIEKTRRRLGMAALISLPTVAVGAWLASGLYLRWLVLLVGLTVIVGLLVVRGVLGSRIECVGMRCRQCDATYRNGSPFFTDRDANPRNLTVADVPRPLGSSPYSRGESVEDEPTKP